MNRPVWDAADLAALVSRRHVVEILDVLARTSVTVAELRAEIWGSERSLLPTLRALAAAGLICHGHGSWDGRPSHPLRLTERGQRVVEVLSSVDMWTAMYEQSDLHVRSPPLRRR